MEDEQHVLGVLLNGDIANQPMTTNDHNHPKPRVYVYFRSCCRLYPHDAMVARVLPVIVCPSVDLSFRHTPVLCQNG